MRPWLGIDTATEFASIAVADETVLAERTWRGQRNHTVLLAPAVADLLAVCGAAVADLGGIAVAIGPGSYTGLRVGLALAKGVALAAGLPVVGVPTLHAVAAALSPPAAERSLDLHAVLLAGRNRYAVVTYPSAADEWPAAAAAEALTLAEILASRAPPAWISGELAPGDAAKARAAGFHVPPAPARVRRAAFLIGLGRAMPLTAPEDLAGLTPAYLGRGLG